MECERFRQLVSDYLADRLDGPERVGWRGHLRACGDCRRRALELEPTLLLGTEPPAAAEPTRVEACVAAVVTLRRQEEMSGRLRGGRRWALAAAAAVILAVSGLLWTLGGHGGGVPADGLSVESGLPAPDVEVEMEGEGVRVYRFADDGEQDTVVAFVVNPALDS